MSSRQTVKTHVIGVDDSIPYVALDPTPGGSNLGRAEFVFCPIWKDERMVELMIYPKQQRIEPTAYRLKLTARRVTQFSFTGGAYGDRYPHCWRMWWCNEHKTVAYEVYVPNGTSLLTFKPHFGDSIDIHFGEEATR